MDGDTDPTWADIGARIESYATEVVRDYHMLRAIVMRHEATIQRRWDKKTKDQRSKFLFRVWPDIAKTRQGHITAIKQIATKWNAVERASGRRLTSKDDLNPVVPHNLIQTIWAPSINLEDLCRPRNLLLLIKSRARNHPCTFAGQDGVSLYTGVLKTWKTAGPTESVVFLNGEQDYGKVMLRDEVPPPYNSLYHSILFQIPEGSQIIDFQKFLLRSLIWCCTTMLHDIPIGEMITDNIKYPIQPEPEVKKIQADESRYVSLSTMVEEATYLPPPGLDIHRIESLLHARFAAAEDHMLALREDPSYFESQWREELDHNPGLVKDNQGRQGYVFDTRSGIVSRPGPAQMWAHSLARMRQKAYEQLEMFGILRWQAMVIRENYLIHRPTITPEKNLPDPLLLQLIYFRNLLHKALRMILEAIDMQFPASPFIRPCLVRPDSHHQATKIRSSVQRSRVDIQFIDKTRFLLRGRDVSLLDNMSAYLDELARYMKDEPETRRLLSGAMAGYIGDLSIIAQCTNQLQMFYPWSRMFDEAMVCTNESVSRKWAEFFDPMAEAVSPLAESLLRDVPLLCDPTDQKYDHPSTKRRTKLNTDKMRQAESNLDMIWDYMDQQLSLYQNVRPESMIKHFHEAHHPMERTPEWIEPSPQPTKHAPSSPRTEDEIPFSVLESLRIGSEQSPAKEEPRKPKTKTRGKPSNKGSSLPAPTPDEEEEPIEEQIKINARAFSVFQKLFFDPDAHREGKGLSWRDFLLAMTYNGLFSAESLNGSAWVFTHQATGHSMEFHEPHHPNPKISAWYARRIGGRLRRRLGWHAKTFVLV